MTSISNKGRFTKSRVLFKEEYENLDHTLIMISEEKLKLELNEYEKSVKYQYSWLAPLGVFLSLLITIVTTDFKDAFSIHKETWQAFFYLGCVISCFYILFNIYQARKHQMSIEQLLDRIKNKNLTKT